MKNAPILRSSTLLATALAALVVLPLQAGCGGGGGSTPTLPTVLAHVYVLDKSGQVRVVELDDTGTLTLIDSSPTTGTNPNDIDIDVSAGILAVVSEPGQVDVMRLNNNGSFGLTTSTPVAGITNVAQCVAVDGGVVFVGSSTQPATVLPDQGLIYSFNLNSTTLALTGQQTFTDLAYYSALEPIGSTLVAASSGNSGFGRFTRTGQNLGPVTSASGRGSVYDLEPLSSGCVFAGFDGSNNVDIEAFNGSWTGGGNLIVPGLMGRSDIVLGPNGRCYVVGSMTSQINTVVLSGTTFTPQASAALPFAADGVAVDPTGKFVIVSDQQTGTLQAVPINPTTFSANVSALPTPLVIGGSAPTKMIAVAP